MRSLKIKMSCLQICLNFFCWTVKSPWPFFPNEPFCEIERVLHKLYHIHLTYLLLSQFSPWKLRSDICSSEVFNTHSSCHYSLTNHSLLFSSSLSFQPKSQTVPSLCCKRCLSISQSSFHPSFQCFLYDYGDILIKTTLLLLFSAV